MIVAFGSRGRYYFPTICYLLPLIYFTAGHCLTLIFISTHAYDGVLLTGYRGCSQSAAADGTGADGSAEADGRRQHG